MSFEVFKKQGCVHRNLGTVWAKDSAKAALELSKSYGKGLYKVRPAYSDSGFFPYRIK